MYNIHCIWTPYFRPQQQYKKAGSNNCLKLIKVTPDSEAQRWDNENIIHKINLTEHKL